MPGSSAWKVQVCRRPGTMSRLPLRRGTQNEWMTSRLVPRMTTLASAGMIIWPLVMMLPDSPVGMKPQIVPSSATG